MRGHRSWRRHRSCHWHWRWYSFPQSIATVHKSDSRRRSWSWPGCRYRPCSGHKASQEEEARVSPQHKRVTSRWRKDLDRTSKGTAPLHDAGVFSCRIKDDTHPRNRRMPLHVVLIFKQGEQHLDDMRQEDAPHIEIRRATKELVAEERQELQLWRVPRHCHRGNKAEA
jgi:hypothetical protein